jgi:hypothetical protein
LPKFVIASLKRGSVHLAATGKANIVHVHSSSPMPGERTRLNAECRRAALLYPHQCDAF